MAPREHRHVLEGEAHVAETFMQLVVGDATQPTALRGGGGRDALALAFGRHRFQQGCATTLPQNAAAWRANAQGRLK
eukprot:15286074-Alexandrium_andersonii.AAC.1